MDLKRFLKELIEETIDAAVDFGSEDSLESENKLNIYSELLYTAIDHLVKNEQIVVKKIK